MLLTVTPVTPCGRGAQLNTDIHSVTERFDWGYQSIVLKPAEGRH